MKYYFTFLLFVLFSEPSVAQGRFEMTEDIVSAYKSVTRLRLQEAKDKISKIKINDPSNLLVYHVENYIDFFTLFISEEKDLYEKLKSNKNQRIAKIKEGDQSSPYYKFSIAEINLQWATVRLKFGSKLTPLREVYTAYQLLEENQNEFPDFMANKKSLSIIHALAENIPGLVRTLFSVKGSIEQGTREISEVVSYSNRNPDFLYREECYAIYAYILFYQNNEKQKAYDLLKSSAMDFSKNPLLCFLMSNIAQKTGHNKEAISILENRPKGPEYLPFYYLDFMYGKFLMYRLDDTAIDYMNTFVTKFKGRHFIKEAYQKLAWYALATNENIVDYKKYMKLCFENGHQLVDEDKQAHMEASKSEVPHFTLLKSRLLFDGGYYQKAYKMLVLKSYQFENDSKYEIEFNYRMGRICQALGSPYDAIEYYLKTINMGMEEDSYFACNSALQTGLILEKQGFYKKAKQLFERCLKIKTSEYENSLYQKAKSGIERVETALNK